MSATVTDLSPSDIETIAKLTSEKNAEVLKNRQLFEEKFPGSVAPSALEAAATEYPIKSYHFGFAAFGYAKVGGAVTYTTGEQRKFTGEGGGFIFGAGEYFGGAPNTTFALSPAEIIGVECHFYMNPVAIGALIHFWTDSVNIGTLVGAGPGMGVGAFGGTCKWSA